MGAAQVVPTDIAVLLRRVQLGAIEGHEQDGQWVIFKGLTFNHVTDEITPLEVAGLVERDDWQGGTIFPRRPYRLTDAGRVELNRYIDKLHAATALR